MNKEIRIGIQKRGNLAEESRRTLQNTGLVFAGPENGLISPCMNLPKNEPRVQVCYERIGYIPEYVEERAFNLGIVGRDLLEEEPRKVDIIASLDFGKCAICFIGPPKIEFSPEVLEGKRIATSKPWVVRNYLRTLGLEKFEVIPKDGNTENMIALGKADFIADIVSTGRTAENCGLVPYWQNGVILESEAILIGNPLSLESNPTGILSVLIESIKDAIRINNRPPLEQWILRQIQQRKLKKALLERR